MNYDKLREEFNNEFKKYFAILSLRCVKCNHIKDMHYWNGGGNQDEAGYDRCKAENCKCIDYDEHNDFEEKIDGYDKTYNYITNFFIEKMREREEEIRKESNTRKGTVAPSTRGRLKKEWEEFRKQNSLHGLAANHLVEDFWLGKLQSELSQARGEVLLELRSRAKGRLEWCMSYEKDIDQLLSNKEK